MALNIRSLSLFNSVPVGTAGDNVNFYHYATTDVVATVTTAGYFDGAASKLKKGDVIEAVCTWSGTPDRVSLIVTAVTTTVVTFAVNTDAAGA
jgi:uncharacterized protein YqfB (UPF0267 family)